MTKHADQLLLIGWRSNIHFPPTLMWHFGTARRCHHTVCFDSWQTLWRGQSSSSPSNEDGEAAIWRPFREWRPPAIKVRMPVNVADGMLGSSSRCSSSLRRWSLLCLMAWTVLEYQGFLAAFLRAPEFSDFTNADGKAVRETMATATQASICCQMKSQTSSKVPRNLSPDTRIEATIAMKRFRERKIPRTNFCRGLILTDHRRRRGIPMINRSVPTSTIISKMAKPRARWKYIGWRHTADWRNQRNIFGVSGYCTHQLPTPISCMTRI